MFGEAWSPMSVPDLAPDDDDDDDSNPTSCKSWTRVVGCQVMSKSLTSDPFKS